jgi:hypothetical protein
VTEISILSQNCLLIAISHYQYRAKSIFIQGKMNYKTEWHELEFPAVWCCCSCILLNQKWSVQQGRHIEYVCFSVIKFIILSTEVNSFVMWDVELFLFYKIIYSLYFRATQLYRIKFLFSAMCVKKMICFCPKLISKCYF